MMMIYDVVRQQGGWAVACGEERLHSYRSREEAIAQARLLGHDAFDRGETSTIRVQAPGGDFRTECTYGCDKVGEANSFQGGRF
jgi:hypothetical protein